MIVDNKVKKQIVGAFLIDDSIDGIKLATTKKPNKIRKHIIYLVLGWKWVDIENIKEK